MEGCISSDSLGNRAGGKHYMVMPFMKVQTLSLKNDVKEVRQGGTGNNVRCTEEQLVGHRTTLLATVQEKQKVRAPGLRQR